MGTVWLGGRERVGLGLPVLPREFGESERSAPEPEARVLLEVGLGLVAVAAGAEDDVTRSGGRPSMIRSTFSSSKMIDLLIFGLGLSPGSLEGFVFSSSLRVAP